MGRCNNQCGERGRVSAPSLSAWEFVKQRGVSAMIRFSHGMAQITLVALLAGSGACQNRETGANFDNYKSLAAGVGKADKVVLYEGLPHQSIEKELLNEELKTKKTVQHHGFPFYSEQMQLKEGDAKKLTDLFTDSDSFRPFRGEKKCGGFHPDYCVEWQAGKEVYRCLVCFGCGEVKVFGPKAELYCDMTHKSCEKFKEVLQSYRKHRPKSKDR